MSFTPATQVSQPIKKPSKDTVLNPKLKFFPTQSIDAIIDRHLTIYEVLNPDNNPLGVYLNGAKMSA